MNKYLNLIIPCIFIIFLVSVGIYTTQLIFIIEHESAHKEIFSEYGIESNIEIDYFKLNGQTVAYVSDNAPTDLYLANNQNDIVGYHTIALSHQLWIMLGIFVNLFLFYKMIIGIVECQ